MSKSLHLTFAVLVLCPGAAIGADSDSGEVPSAKPASAAASSPSTAREACAERKGVILRAICMDIKCDEPRFRSQTDCVALRKQKY